MLQQRTWLGYLSIVRILVGIQFLMVSWPKIAGGRFLAAGGKMFAEELLKASSQDPLAWHRAFITGFVVPHAHYFSYLVAFGETAIAISLITGCLVRVSSCFGAFHNFNIYFALGYAAGASTMNYNRLLILLHVIFVITSAGRVLGLDGLLAKKFPRSQLF